MSPELFRRLSGIGLSNDQIAAVLEIMESESAERKAKARARVQKWRDNKAAGATKSKPRNVTKRNVTSRSVTEGLTRAEGSSSKLEVGSYAASAAKGNRIPEDWQPDELFALREGMPPAECKRQADRFRDYWRSKPGQSGVKLDWSATWRNWVRKSMEDRRVSASAARRSDGRI